MIVSAAATNEHNLAILELAKKRFQETHPKVQLNVELLPKEILEQRLREKTAPDVVEWDGVNIGKLLDEGLLLDLTPFAKDGSVDMADYYPSVWRAVTDRDRIGGIPVMAEVTGVFYNKKQFDEAGLPYPQDDWTWEQFTELAEKLTTRDPEGDIVRHGAYLVPRLLPVEPLVWSNGGAFLSADGKTASGYLNGSHTVEAIRKYMEMFYLQKLQEKYTR
jgi:multiple sugar transport system substrate-binding protein